MDRTLLTKIFRKINVNRKGNINNNLSIELVRVTEVNDLDLLRWRKGG